MITLPLRSIISSLGASSVARFCCAIVALLAILADAPAAPAPVIPPWLPRYDLDVNIDTCDHKVQVHERVTWTNAHRCPANELVFNAHSHYEIPKNQIGFLAKMAEILRMTPGQNMDFGPPPLQVESVHLVMPVPGAPAAELPFHYRDDNPTALEIPLPHPVGPNESVTVEITFTLRLPQKQGRWGQWLGVTFLTNWLPVVAFFDEKGWQPTPYIPWHQPWFNEAGVFTARVTLPSDEKLACTGSIVATRDLGNGLQRLDVAVPAARDFALVCSNRFVEYSNQVGPTKIKVLAFPEHEFYANAILRVASEAIPVYSKWFGPYPYPEYTIVESYFGWNGNECAGLVMIDERIFDMPHLAENYVDYLISHETCHQWFYNAIGTNGYRETFMDEAFATYFAHRLLNQKVGKNNQLLQYPRGLEWLPSIYRENYRFYGLYGTIGRGECTPTISPMDQFGHVVNLFSMCYDKGSKIVGMIEDRLGDAAFIDFMRHIYSKYYFRIITCDDLQHELEAYTGHSWDEFFQHWLHDKGLTDWSVEKVKIEGDDPSVVNCRWLRKLTHRNRHEEGACSATIVLHQKAEFNEQTVLGIALEDNECYQIRIPILPQAQHMELDDPPAVIDVLPDNRVRVVVRLPSEPTQIAVDPDQVLVDKDPTNNYWKPRLRCHLTPLMTFLDETALTNDYDKWNFNCGPWLFFPAYEDPWFTRSAMVGARAGLYRTEDFVGGVYAAYRTDYDDVVVGGDALWDHLPWSHTQMGLVAEQRLATAYQGQQHANRAVAFGRYIFDYGDSLYLPPFHYLETYGTVQDDFLPVARIHGAGAERYDYLSAGGLHYHINFLTPYWDPEGGFALDATYAAGSAKFGDQEFMQQLIGQVSTVKFLPEWTGAFLSQTRIAVRAFGATAEPAKGEFFALGGSDRFRGFSTSDRQGSTVWVGSVEWRVPLAKGLTWDTCDHVVGLRNIYGAAFYDVGDAYIHGQSVGGNIAHAVGAGLRLDMEWFSFIERSVLRLDVAKTVSGNTPIQVWFGVDHPF